jgi:hypothetical protein
MFLVFLRVLEMAIQVEWDTKLSDTIHWNFDGKWQWDDFFVAYAREEALTSVLNQGRYDTIGIFKGAYVPLGNAIGNVFRVLEKRRQRGCVMVVICTQSMFLVSMMNTLKRLHPHLSDTFVAVQTLEQGYHAIEESRKKASAAG